MMGFQCLVVILVAQYSYETKQWLLCYLQALINQFNTVQSARSDICQKKKSCNPKHAVDRTDRANSYIRLHMFIGKTSIQCAFFGSYPYYFIRRIYLPGKKTLVG